jgi:hypothetical protein
VMTVRYDAFDASLFKNNEISRDGAKQLRLHT